MPSNPAPAFRPDHVRVESLDPARPGGSFATWCIELDSNATVPEFVLLVIAFRCRAEIITGEVTRMVPVDPRAPMPTAAQIAQVFERGLEFWRPAVARTELELVR